VLLVVTGGMIKFNFIFFSHIFALLTHQGAVQAITAGVVGGWWHRPGEKGLVCKVCFQTIFYSSGSICFGSLFVGPVRLLRQLSSPFRPTSTQSTSLECLQECIFCVQSCLASFIDTVAAGCNSWAFTYIGMYHYGFLDAGYNATELFERRGWSTIVSDDLVPNVLFFTSLVIGGATGCFAHLISVTDELVLSPESHGTLSFFQGFVLGLALTSILFSTVSAAVDSVLVCFASSPLDFEQNHKELSHEMRAAWREVWPGALDACDAATMPPMAQGSPLSFHGSFHYGEGTPLL
jgi:Plasma-membrane choline transporter